MEVVRRWVAHKCCWAEYHSHVTLQPAQCVAPHALVAVVGWWYCGQATSDCVMHALLHNIGQRVIFMMQPLNASACLPCCRGLLSCLQGDGHAAGG
jgi:hypothetical protein